MTVTETCTVLYRPPFSGLPLIKDVEAQVVALAGILCDNPVDLLFLDIQMPAITGLQFMKLLGAKSRVIFTTAYTDYALDGYEYNAIDYLLKPVTFDRFYTAALKARDVFAGNRPQVIVQPQFTAASDFIFVKTDSKMVKVFLKDILYMEGLKDYIANSYLCGNPGRSG